MKLLKKHPTFLQVFLQSLLWKCFLKTVLYCGTRIGRKSFWCFATLSAKFCLHSKAAKTPCCWKCCCQQQNEPINLLAKGGAISTRNSGPKCSIGPPRARNFIVTACCWQQHFQQDGVFAAFESKKNFAERVAKLQMFFHAILSKFVIL